MSPSEQARADALADAETLRLMALEANSYFASDYDPEFKTWTREDRTGYWIRDAQHYGYLAIGGAIDFCAERAAEAARAAFRAVPGLREGE